MSTNTRRHRRTCGRAAVALLGWLCLLAIPATAPAAVNDTIASGYKGYAYNTAHTSQGSYVYEYVGSPSWWAATWIPAGTALWAAPYAGSTYWQWIYNYSTTRWYLIPRYALRERPCTAPVGDVTGGLTGTVTVLARNSSDSSVLGTAPADTVRLLCSERYADARIGSVATGYYIKVWAGGSAGYVRRTS